MNELIGSCRAPIADIRQEDTRDYVDGEAELRCNLASLYRLVDLQGWSQGIFNHITVRVHVGEQDHFLINPFGMLYSEITASSLVKVDLAGKVVGTGSTTLGINPAGFLLHSTIHDARPDVNCIIHFHTGACAAVSSMKCGLLRLCQESGALGEISYHAYEGILVEVEERPRIIASLGPVNKVMLLGNHGVVTCGATIEEAFHLAYNYFLACEVQVKAVAAGVDNLNLIPKEAQDQVFKVYGNRSAQEGYAVGQLEFEGWMRLLDSKGYRTRYVYKNLLWRPPAKPVAASTNGTQQRN